MASDNSMVASYGMTLRSMRGALTLVPQPLLSATSAYVGFIGGAADLVAHPFRRVIAVADIRAGRAWSCRSYLWLRRSRDLKLGTVLVNLTLCRIASEAGVPGATSARWHTDVHALRIPVLRHYAEHEPYARSSLRVMSGGGAACPRLPETAMLFTVRPLRRPDISGPTVWPYDVLLRSL